MDIKALLDAVVKEKASDLIVTAGAPPMLRIHGELRPAPRWEALTAEQARALIYGLLSAEQRKFFEERKELDFSMTPGRKQRFRVNVYLQRQTVAAALRPIPETVPSFKELGLPGDVAALALMKQGLILVTGPTGHGKTTTLASIVDFINASRACHIITIEDPVEYVHSHKKSIVGQREIGGDTLTFPNALKYVLRQSPDVIMIGEVR
ncbi:MAG TPA: ATPase, T2SS/T4P/T4SS family, partial [Candidatus Hydrogenedentes bacterium]|nr:ATPase, T2SS/T4P/T4SS family [Candidatus Hydrogenedentota bacterium]